jgi:uncharacterized protein (TIGR03067 family)
MLPLLIVLLLSPGAGAPGGKATLELHLATSASAPGARPLQLPLAGGGSEEIFFDELPFLSSDGVASADAFVAPGGRGEVRVALTPEGARTLAAVTEKNVGKRVGIVVDGRLLAAPYLMAPLRDGKLVIAGLSLGEAQALAPRLGPSTASERAKVAGPPDRSVLAALEGTWIGKVATLNGEVVPDKKITEGKWTFREGTLALTTGTGESGRFTLATVPGAPGAFRLEPVPPSPEKPISMIFVRDGDRLRVAFYDGKDGRPTDFSPESKKVVLELERKGR